MPDWRTRCSWAAAALFEDDFIRLGGTVGMYFSGPDLRYGDNENQSTGLSATEVLTTDEETHGESPVPRRSGRTPTTLQPCSSMR